MDRLRYTPVFWGLMDEFGLSLSELILLSLIIGPIRKMCWVCQASKRTLAKRMGKSDVTVYNLVKLLIKKGVIQKGGYSPFGVRKLEVTDEVKRILFRERRELGLIFESKK